MAVLVCGMVASASKADSVIGKIILSQDTNNYSRGQGGEFKVTINYVPSPDFVAVQDASVKTPGLTPVPTGSSGTAAQATFQTFCIEAGDHDVFFNPGVTYKANFIDANPASTNSTPWLHLYAATQALYHAFSTGALAAYGYDYTPGAGRSHSAGELQAAIWVSQGDFNGGFANAALQGQSGIYDGFSQAQSWLTLATSGALAGTGGSVHALSLVNPESPFELHQTQLIDTPSLRSGNNPTPLPTTVAMALSMLGVLGVGSTLRKRINLKTRIA